MKILTPFNKTLFSTLLLTTMLTMTSGCSLFRVYTIDLPQGTPVTQQQAQRLKLGMNQAQVLYLLGTPAFKDTLEANRWDYLYDYEAGTHGKRAGNQNIHNAQQHLKVYFEGNIVSRIEGRETLPEKATK